ncbi:MAG: VWA domain-containing protein [Myxococcales bacterium]|nr:VWA domain-containing protein [Myxococcales bacterium]
MSSPRRLFSAFALAAAAAGFFACGSEADEAPGSGGSGAGGAGGTGGLNLGGGGSSGSGGVLIDSGNNDAIDPDAGCFYDKEEGKNTPLHLFIALDKSSSMSGFKWDAAKAGLIAFVNNPTSGGVHVGLKLFPRAIDGTPVCDQKPYATPDTPFALLPGNATAIETAIKAAVPDGLSTPVYPALGGALLKGIEITQNNPGHTAAVLLVTDGQPAGPAPLCGSVNPELTSEIAKIAASGLSYSVLTFVIGLPGVDQAFANAVAQAGGTTSAILVSNTNVQKEFENALAKVRGEALPCEFEIPDKVQKGEIAFNKVNVGLTPAGGALQLLKQTTDCAKGGDWYYSATTPKKIVFCPSTCAAVKKDYGAKIEIQLGCDTVIK